jgi:ribosomal protein S27AE
MNSDASRLNLQYGIRTLAAEEFLVDCGILDEGVISVHASLDGGKRKRKKKVYTTPKRIPHKHLKRPKALLQYFSVDDASGKVKRLKQESPQAAGAYMADHPDRYTCGKTGTMFYKLTADGKRLPIPKQNKKAAAVVEKVAAKKAPAKKKK